MSTNTKIPSDTYLIRNAGHCSYAIISIGDINEGQGFLSITSDYGSWNFVWGSMGQSIRDFLIRCDKYYLMDKLTYDNRSDRDVFDEYKSYDLTVKTLEEMLQTGEITIEDYDNSVEDLNYIRDNCNGSQDIYCQLAMNTEYLWSFLNYESLPIYTSYSNSLNGFFDEVWPVFISIISEEV